MKEKHSESIAQSRHIYFLFYWMVKFGDFVDISWLVVVTGKEIVEKHFPTLYSSKWPIRPLDPPTADMMLKGVCIFMFTLLETCVMKADTNIKP